MPCAYSLAERLRTLAGILDLGDDDGLASAAPAAVVATEASSPALPVAR